MKTGTINSVCARPTIAPEGGRPVKKLQLSPRRAQLEAHAFFGKFQ